MKFTVLIIEESNRQVIITSDQPLREAQGKSLLHGIGIFRPGVEVTKPEVSGVSYAFPLDAPGELPLTINIAHRAIAAMIHRCFPRAEISR